MDNRLVIDHLTTQLPHETFAQTVATMNVLHGVAQRVKTAKGPFSDGQRVVGHNTGDDMLRYFY